jgi:hypothetical protein
MVIGCFKGAPSGGNGLEPGGARLHPFSDPERILLLSFR